MITQADCEAAIRGLDRCCGIGDLYRDAFTDLVGIPHSHEHIANWLSNQCDHDAAISAMAKSMVDILNKVEQEDDGQ